MTLIPPTRFTPTTVDPWTLMEQKATAEFGIVTHLWLEDYVMVSLQSDNMELDRRVMTLQSLQLLFSQPWFSVTGDLVSFGNNVTIQPGVVSFAKMQNVSWHSMLARVGGSAGSLSEITLWLSSLIGRGSTWDITPITIWGGLFMTWNVLSSTVSWSVNSVITGTWVTIDNTDSANPVVNLSLVTLTALSKAMSALQTGSNISRLTNDSGYISSLTGNWIGTFDGQEWTYYLNRSNHTGSQLASTISNFDSKVASNAAVAANTTKLAGIEANAQKNVKSDWNSITGDSQILNKPTIPAAYSLPTASKSVLGGVKVDGTTITISGGVISSTGGGGGGTVYSSPAYSFFFS